jgi:hypothetical protein
MRERSEMTTTLYDLHKLLINSSIDENKTSLDMIQMFRFRAWELTGDQGQKIMVPGHIKRVWFAQCLACENFLNDEPVDDIVVIEKGISHLIDSHHVPRDIFEVYNLNV